ncbi:hypothetical protein [Clostridium sp. YIM B02500]|uniref:hypothetical protein n=1 Tax=Clostridium sp. YIM B02500 TaxID=2910681 RepID=UPI001EEEFDE1|nr:hypothetical protein [Clostridium sp. YIM B02500]
MKFTGDNKSAYIVIAGEVANSNFTSKSSGLVKSESENKWYYVDNTETKTGRTTVNGRSYYLDNNGVMLHDAYVDGYYLDSDGGTHNFEEYILIF